MTERNRKQDSPCGIPTGITISRREGIFNTNMLPSSTEVATKLINKFG